MYASYQVNLNHLDQNTVSQISDGVLAKFLNRPEKMGDFY